MKRYDCCYVRNRPFGDSAVDNREAVAMYSVYISGGYRGSFKTLQEAMAEIQKSAITYRLKWEIKDPYQKVCASG